MLFQIFFKICRIRVFYFGQRRFFSSIVGGADLVCAFECHVFKHMGKAGDANHLLRRSGINVREEREDRGFRSFNNHHGQTV